MGLHGFAWVCMSLHGFAWLFGGFSVAFRQKFVHLSLKNDCLDHPLQKFSFGMQLCIHIPNRYPKVCKVQKVRFMSENEATSLETV